MIQNKKNIIIGASGLIGGALYDTFSKLNQQVIGTCTTRKSEKKDLINFDMTTDDFSPFLDLINSQDNIYLLSAYSNPSWIYDNKAATKKLNLTGTKKLINALKEKNPRIIFMSSVEVFNGETGNYDEFDLPQPLNYYGQLKYEIEKYLKEEYQNSTIVRTGWNIGLNTSSRCVVALTYESLLRPNARMAIDNQFSVVSVADTANALSRLSAYPEIKLLHICSNEVITRTRLAQLICANSVQGDKMLFEDCYFHEIKYTEPRGRLNSLNNLSSKTLLDMRYESAEKTIIDKVHFLDARVSNC